MTPELKSKWLAALRSGKYEQGHGALNSNGKMCCLGVLCDVAGYEWLPSGDGDYLCCDAGTYSIENEQERLALGLEDDIQEISYSMNDGRFGTKEEYRVYSFAEIADFLEKNLKDGSPGERSRK
jgi:hypothetical protein